MTGTLFPNGNSSVPKSPPYLSRVSSLGFQIICFPPRDYYLLLFQSESTLLKVVQRGEVMTTTHWVCKLMLKEEEEGLYIDLLDYVNLSEKEEDKIPKNSSYPNFCLYKFPDRFNGIKYRPKLKKELHSSGIAGGCSLISNIPCTMYHVACHGLYKQKVNLERKYEEGSDYMDGIATATAIQNTMIKMRGPTGPKKSRKSQTMPLWC
jgi:hypothetical protein